MGWWSFKKIGFGAFGEGEYSWFNERFKSNYDCDLFVDKFFHSEVAMRCDPYIQIYIDGVLDKETDKYMDQELGRITLDYRTKLVSKTTPVRFKMLDFDKGSKDDILLDKTFTVEQLIDKKYNRIYADQRPGKDFGRHNDNFIEIYQSVWKDEYDQV